jgi:hypothetical protein
VVSSQDKERTFKGKLAMKTETAERRQKRLIRAVYPNGSDERGYHVVFTMLGAKQVEIPNWLTRWAGKFAPQTSGGY